MPTVERVTFRLLHPATVQVVGELATVVGARWTRRFGAAGDMELRVHARDHLVGRVLQPNAGIQVVRDGLVEDTYWVHGWRIDLAEGDDADLVWTVRALTVPMAVSLRAAVPAPNTTDGSTTAGADSQAFSNLTPAQILRTLMDTNVVSPAEQARDVATVALGNVYIPAKVSSPEGVRRPVPLDTVDPADTATMPAMTRRVRFGQLLDELVGVAAQGGVSFRFRPEPGSGVVYFDVLIPADRRARVGASWPTVTFSLQRRRLRQFSYELNGFDLVNAVYALGSGSGATRVLGVAKATTNFRDFLARDEPSDPYVLPAQYRTWPRREEVLDARVAGTSADARAQVQDYLLRHQAPETITFQPVANAPGATYLVDWDVGDLVTVDVAEIGLSGDTRITEVQTELHGTGVPVTSITCGRIPRDLGSVVREVGRVVRPANVE